MSGVSNTDLATNQKLKRNQKDPYNK